MRTQLLSETGKRVLSAVSLCCIWAVAVPTSAKAAPAFGDAVCPIQVVKMPNAPATWQIKGTASVTDLPAGTMSVVVKARYQKMAKGAVKWSDVSAVTQMPAPVNGTATIDTGFQNFTPAPAQGDQYRVLFSGYYVLVGAPGVKKPLGDIGSVPITPVP